MIPYCVITDIQRLRPQREAFSATTPTTTTEAKEVIRKYASQLRTVMINAGYDTDNLHEESSTVALSITGSANAQNVTVADGTQFSAGDIVKIEGLTSGAENWEYSSVVSVTNNVVNLIVTQSYDAATVTIYVVNDALRIVRDLNALGAAAEIEQNEHMGISPNESTHAEKLFSQYYGSEECQCGLWAIKNLEGFLEGATQTTDAIVENSISSYGSVHSTDDDVEPGFEIDMDF